MCITFHTPCSAIFLTNTLAMLIHMLPLLITIAQYGMWNCIHPGCSLLISASLFYKFPYLEKITALLTTLQLNLMFQVVRIEFVLGKKGNLYSTDHAQLSPLL